MMLPHGIDRDAFEKASTANLATCARRAGTDDLVKGRAFRSKYVSCAPARAYQFLDGSSFVNRVARVRQARGAAMPVSVPTDPSFHQGGADRFLDRTAHIAGSPDWAIDFEGGIAVVTVAVPMGADRKTALEAIRIVTL